MRTIKIPKSAKLFSSGSYGSYYKLSKRKGMKVIWHTRITVAEKEASYLNAAAKAGLAPRCHEVVKVEHKLGWTNYGLIVDHVDGRSSGWQNGYTDAQKKLEKDLRAIGIVNRDLFGNNVRKTKKGYMVVDFSPSQCRFIR